MAKFKKGDVVQLKSGGVSMTVADVDDYSNQGKSENGVKCVWQEGAKHFEEVYDEEVLQLAPARGIGAGSATVNVNNRRKW